MRTWQRIASLAVIGTVIGVVAACDDQSVDYGYGYGGSFGVRCGDYKGCGTCTPVVGCGWCATGNGTGTCTDGPDNCSGAPAGFTWDPTGCGALEGGAPTRDGGHAIAEAGLSPSGDASSHDDANATDANATDGAQGDGSADAASD